MTPTRDPITGQWEITDVPPFTVNGETFDSYGPYTTRADAESTIRRLEKFNKLHAREFTEENKQAADLAGSRRLVLGWLASSSSSLLSLSV